MCKIKTNQGWRITQELATTEASLVLGLERKKGEGSYQNLVEHRGHCRKVTPSWNSGFGKRTTATVKPSVNRDWRPSREGIFFLLQPSHQLMPLFCRSQLGTRGRGNPGDILYNIDQRLSLTGLKGQRVDLAGPIEKIQGNTEVLIFLNLKQIFQFLVQNGLRKQSFLKSWILSKQHLK